MLEEHALTGWAKTSGKRGLHIYVRILPQWTFAEVRRAALALARKVERRMDGVAVEARARRVLDLDPGICFRPRPRGRRRRPRNHASRRQPCKSFKTVSVTPGLR